MVGETFSTRSITQFQRQELRAGLQDLPKRLFESGLLLAAALVAFEIFSFRTTQYALADLLGDVSFVNIRWATILAIAFCAIDIAGLLRFFTLGQSGIKSFEAWYLMGAWLLGATMGAFMAWWAVSVTVLYNWPTTGLLSQIQILDSLPIVVAILVWLMRIIFIGLLGAGAGYMFGASGDALPNNKPAPSF